MSGLYLLILAPNVNNESVLDYQPFGVDTLRKLINEAADTAKDAALASRTELKYRHHVPFPYYYLGTSIDDLDEESLNLLANDTPRAIVDCELLKESTIDVEIVSILTAFKAEWKLAYTLNSDEFADNKLIKIGIMKIPVSSDGELRICLLFDLLPTNLRYLLDYMDRLGWQRQYG